MGKIKKPIAGYYGSLTNANDQDAFIEIAKDGFSVVVIGKVVGNYSKCLKYNNIHFLGPIKFGNLPSYAQYFDVCLLNWINSQWIINCFPLKALEYLAMGKPIVSVEISELKNKYSDYIYFANNSKEFPGLCRLAISQDSDEKINKRKELVKNETWENRFKTFKELIVK